MIVKVFDKLVFCNILVDLINDAIWRKIEKNKIDALWKFFTKEYKLKNERNWEHRSK